MHRVETAENGGERKRLVDNCSCDSTEYDMTLNVLMDTDDEQKMCQPGFRCLCQLVLNRT